MPLRNTFQFLCRGTALGALVAMTLTASAAEPIEKVWSAASPVQAYGIAPPNRMPGQVGPGIQVVNDASTGGEVYFLLDGQEKSLQPGQALDLPADRPYSVEFNSGGSYGDLRFTLYQGTYKFKVMPEGWALFKSSSAPSMSGSAPVVSARPQSPRGYTPPMPAEDLRTRRVAGRTEVIPAPAPRPTATPQPPTVESRSAQEATPTIAAPPPPGVTRDRTAAPRTP